LSWCGEAEALAEKTRRARHSPQRRKPENQRRSFYRSGEPLRHPKARIVRKV
jgi:hypothetical protein